MKAYRVVQNVYWVSVKDWNRRIFDSIIPLPRGISYNVYLIIGNNEYVLIDIVNPKFEEELVEKISSVIDPKDLDYIVMNHAELSRTDAIPYLMKINSKAKVITTSMGLKLASKFYNLEPWLLEMEIQ